MKMIYYYIKTVRELEHLIALDVRIDFISNEYIFKKVIAC